jgi:L-ascorbate metabolism protein UlaG (beta-lactamase superfamily)
MKLILEKIGCKNVIELNNMESLEAGDMTIYALPFLGEHSDLNILSKAAFAVRVGAHTLLFAADSCNIEPRLYEHLRAEIGDVDALFLGMECDGAPLTWLYGPLLTKSIERAMDESRRLSGSDFEQAMSLVRQFGCKSAYVYAMGQEPWLTYIMSLKYTDESRQIIESNRLIDECAKQGIYAERLFGQKEVLIGEMARAAS